MTCRPDFPKTKQRRLSIPMPWRQKGYLINLDEMATGRWSFFACWWFEHRCFFMRAGWSFNK